MAKIVLDAGHGGHDSGAVGHGIKEKDIALNIAKKVARYLHSYNCETKLTRTTDVFVTLGNRSRIANNWGANLFVSIHCNSAKSSAAIGYESFVRRLAGSNDIKIQNAIHPLSAKMFTKDRGKKRALFSVLRRTRMPAILTENGFVSNATDASKLKSDAFRQKVAESIGKGIVQYFNLQKKQSKGVSELGKYQNLLKKYGIINDPDPERKFSTHDHLVTYGRLLELILKLTKKK